MSVKAGSVTSTIGARVIYAARHAGCAQPLRVLLRLVLAHATPKALVPVVLRARWSEVSLTKRWQVRC